MTFFEELKRRNVLRVAAAYIVAAWLVIQVAETIFPLFGFGDTPARITVIVLAILFVPAIIFTWAFELTPDGLKREHEVDRSQSITPQTGKRLDRIIMVVLAIALGFFSFDKFVLDPARDATREESIARKARSEAVMEAFGDNSIAVLPFVNMSSDAEQEYFSDGIAEEVLNLLANVPELRVISRSSAFSYRGKNIDIPTVAEQLNVAHVLEGSVRKSGNRVRIAVQLIEARSDTHIWSETYDRTLEDIFSTQEEIAASVVAQLELELLRNNRLKIRRTDPDAYAKHLQARYIRRQGTEDSFERAIQLYSDSLAIDPEYPLAWEGLAEAYVYQALYGFRRVDEASRLARDAINRSLAIDPDFGVGLAGLGWIAILFDHDAATAARYFKRAHQLGPRDLEIISGVAFLAESIGQVDTAIAFKEYAVARDPMGPVGHIELAYTYLHAGRVDDAIANTRTGIALQPAHVGARTLLGLALLLQGDVAMALKTIDEEPLESSRLTGLALAYAKLNNIPESDRNLQQIIDKYADESSYQIACIYAVRGERDAAFEWLDKARQNNDPGLSGLVTNYWLRGLHDDSRWQLFLTQLGKSEAQLADIDFDVRLPE